MLFKDANDEELRLNESLKVLHSSLSLSYCVEGGKQEANKKLQLGGVVLEETDFDGTEAHGSR